ncbi:MAG: SRPBCC domain-containing protein [Humibacillus sp.]|nr:SRPBCC domain-containing protein [Humibacillus sp.]MDN5775809.1 SRPBCC domain-containing protein [Humibacillus sp.]
MSSETQAAPEGGSDGLTPRSGTESAEGAQQTVRVSHRVAADVTDVWEHLVSPAGTAALFGAGAELGTKGESWRSHDGPHGVLRSYHPLEQVRVSWHADDDGPASLVDLHLVPDGDATRVDIVHERLTSTDAHPDLEGHWQRALDRFASGVG